MYATDPHHAQENGSLRRSPLDFAALFSGLILLTLLGTLAFWQFWHANRIYAGVSIGGVPIGGMTRAAAVAELRETLPTYPLPPVSLYSDQQQWPLPTDQIDATYDPIDAANRAYLLGRQGTFSQRLAQQIRLAVRGHDLTPPLDYDVTDLRYVVSQIAGDVRRPGRAQTQVGEIVVPAQPGLDVDEDATLSMLANALETRANDAHIRVPLATLPLDPPAQIARIAADPDALLSQPPLPLRLVDSRFGLDLALDPNVVNRFVFTRVPLRVDLDELERYLIALADDLFVPSRDARLRFNPDTGGVTIIQSSQVGRELDVDATGAAIQTALVNGATSAELVMRSLEPAVDMNRVAEMGIRELVASGTTYFAGSSAARIRNIEVAAEKFKGVVIPPGETFSFNRFVEDVTAANGFEDSAIIWGDRTAIGVGGGVCQVSTTIFRAAYQAGLPIVERYNHGYVVSWYGEPGMDATIYTPTVDFRFRNDTDAFLLVDPEVDAVGGSMTFNLYGTKPARQVTISEPLITDIEEPGVASYQVDEALASGEIEQVEWPKEGMSVQIERTIVEAGTTRTDTITSYYQPWRAIYLVGPGTAVPDTTAGG